MKPSLWALGRSKKPSLTFALAMLRMADAHSVTSVGLSVADPPAGSRALFDLSSRSLRKASLRLGRKKMLSYTNQLG